MNTPPTKATMPALAVPDIQHTVPEVFVIESLGKADEKARRYEGQMLCDMLRLAGKNPKYYYFQNAGEIPHIIGLFRESQYRFLHLSSHANSTHIGLTNEKITYKRFADLFEGHLKLRRLFLSACGVGNQKFVDAVSAKNKGMHSIVAPAEKIRFDHAAALWSAFYISIFTHASTTMSQSGIQSRVRALSRLFLVDMFLATYRPKQDDWNCRTIEKS